MAKTRVKALRSFTGRVGNQVWHVQEGESFTLPDGAPWVLTGDVMVMGEPYPLEEPDWLQYTEDEDENADAE